MLLRMRVSGKPVLQRNAEPAMQPFVSGGLV